MKKRITFRMHAFSDAAGKYNPDAVRGGNEDNFYVDDNLCDEIPGHCESDKVTDLCDLGLIMAVADGMGGMNAGEVASEIAVNTIQDFFAPGKVTDKIAKDHESRKQYLEKLIIEADNRIKKDAKQNPEHEGMGSTIILAWIVGSEMTLSWVGDSRAYRFNPATGIELISEDHSYVQELVQQGLITYDQTFEHPQGNIITRSLGDTSKRIQPETRFFNVYDHDIILLCSDGLSGVLRDRKTPDGEGGYFPGDNLEDLIRENSTTLVGCREALWQAAEKADWYDNVTAILCEIQSGAGKAPVRESLVDNKTDESIIPKPFWSRTIAHLTPKNMVITLAALASFSCIVILGIKQIHKRHQKEETIEQQEIIMDSVEEQFDEEHCNRLIDVIDPKQETEDTIKDVSESIKKKDAVTSDDSKCGKPAVVKETQPKKESNELTIVEDEAIMSINEINTLGKE